MHIKNQRLMTFSNTVDVTEAKGEHKLYLSFTKRYIENKNVLDIGSWTGPYEILIYNIAKQITAVDIEEKALRILKQNLPKVNCIKAKAHNLPFNNDFFDVITFWDVLEHIPVGYELASISESARVLKKGGYLFLATPSKNFWSNLLDPAYWLTGHRHYSKEQLVMMLEDSGFKIEKIEKLGSFFSSLYALTFYFFKHVLRTKLPTINYVEEKMAKDISSPGYIQFVIHARKIK